MTEHIRQQLAAAKAAAGPNKPPAAASVQRKPPRPTEDTTRAEKSPQKPENTAAPDSPWRITRARGLSYHRIVCQAGPEADAEDFIAYLRAYRP